MTPLHPKDEVPNHWLRSVFALSHLLPHKSAVLAAAGLKPEALQDAGTPVHRGAESLVLKALADRLNAPYAGAEIGVALDPRNSSLLTYILFNSDTLQDALYHVQRFTPIHRPRARIDIRLASDHVDFVIDGIGSDILLNNHMVEFSLGAILGALRMATGVSQVAARIGLANVRKHGQRTLSTIYGCPVDLDAGANYLRFSKTALDTPIRNADTTLLRHLTQYGEVLLETAQPVPATLSEAIERHLLRGMADGRPRLSDVARHFRMSERTLSRRLQDEDHSFQTLVMRAQLKLAHTFLGDPQLSLAETAHLCGFADQSSFSQAYRRWTGRTPKADRRRLLKGEKLS